MVAGVARVPGAVRRPPPLTRCGRVADAPLRARIGAKARERVMAHALDHIAALYSAAIDDVLEERARLGAADHRE